MAHPRLEIRAQDGQPNIPQMFARVMADGQGRRAQIRLADSWFSRSVTCYCSNVNNNQDNLQQVDAVHHYVQFNRGSLIEYLKTKQEGANLSTGYFFGLVGGSSDKEIRAVWNQVMGESEHLNEGSIAVNVTHETLIDTMNHMIRLRQEGYAVVHDTLGTADIAENQQCRVQRGGKADEKIMIFINTPQGGEVEQGVYQQRIDAVLAQIVPSLDDRLGIHEIEVCIANQDQALDQALTERVNAWKAQHLMPI